MSTEMMLNSPPQYTRVDAGCEEKRRGIGHSRTLLALLVVFILIGMAIMFTGGYYAGRHHGDKDKHDQPPPQQQTYRIETSDGSFVDVPALSGNQPAEDFLQCRSVTVNGVATCVPSNPILTPKGSVQFTLYQFGDDVTVIVTATGSKYGESNTTSSRTARSTSPGDLTMSLHALNYRGYISQPGSDDFHSNMKGLHFPEESHATSLGLSWNPYTSSSLLLHLNRTEWRKKMAFYLQHNIPQSDIPQSLLRGGENLSHWSIDFPTEQKPFMITPSPEIQFPEPTTFEQPEEPFIDIAKSQINPQGNVFLGSLQDLRQPTKRSTPSLVSSEQSQRGALFKLFDEKSPKVGLSTIRVIHDPLHGGSNGTIMFDVTNHTSKCRAQFSMLFHNFLSDGQSLENTTHHQLFMYRHMNMTHKSLSMWKGVTPPNSLASSRATPLIGKIPSHLDCISDELGQLNQRLTEMQKGMGSPSRQRRHLLWSCGWGESLIGGAECGYHGFKCGSDIGEGDVTFGLSLFKAAKDCYGAVHSCGGFLHKCW